ncbi:hypothetical protein G3580_06990 [Nitrogeniibacter mangrovi]|uniref:Uncharacterized protein n=1 Tax=Nitrogeniibacter mangrovi TaxID=2016596 RepID=A0A6C1B218_9RHOO|nr:DUF6502 family protein [Nitrogeniibacter mangrovi]QID17413.1 hypothetical protein G3580_06990 [Nitrogeniibacter mangrovi]
MPTATPSAALVRALRRVLRPLVRLMLARGITFPLVAEMLKGVFVEVADREFRLEGRLQSDSRISLLTGVHRKDVKRLRLPTGETSRALPDKVSFGAQLISVWTSVEPFCDGNRRPLPLPRLASHGAERSFESLVAHQSTDIRARVVLDEWLRLGMVTLNAQDEVVLESQAFVPGDGGDEQLAYFGHNVHDHLAAAVHNVTGAGAPFFERSVHYDRLSGQSVERIAGRLKEDGMALLLDFNALAMQCEQDDAARPDNDRRMTIGLYFFSESGAHSGEPGDD